MDEYINSYAIKTLNSQNSSVFVHFNFQRKYLFSQIFDNVLYTIILIRIQWIFLFIYLPIY